MTDRMRVLVDVSLAIGLSDPFRLEIALQDAVVHAAIEEIEEVLLQSHLFVGYPRALNALAMWRQLSGIPAREAPTSDQAEWPARGMHMFTQVYGPQHARVLENARALHPDLAEWMISDGYGRVLGRNGLDLLTRELCIVALLCVQDAPSQLYSHLRGALNAGAGMTQVEELVARLGGALDDKHRRVLVEQWSAVSDRRMEGATDVR